MKNSSKSKHAITLNWVFCAFIVSIDTGTISFTINKRILYIINKNTAICVTDEELYAFVRIHFRRTNGIYFILFDQHIKLLGKISYGLHYRESLCFVQHAQYDLVLDKSHFHEMTVGVYSSQDDEKCSLNIIYLEQMRVSWPRETKGYICNVYLSKKMSSA